MARHCTLGTPDLSEGGGKTNRKHLTICKSHAVLGHLRVSQVRANTKAETNATLVLQMKLEEVSAKVRTGFPKDDEKDYALPDVWAGVLPFAPLQTLEPINDERLLDGIQLPKSVSSYKRPHSMTAKQLMTL